MVILLLLCHLSSLQGIGVWRNPTSSILVTDLVASSGPVILPVLDIRGALRHERGSASNPSVQLRLASQQSIVAMLDTGSPLLYAVSQATNNIASVYTPPATSPKDQEDVFFRYGRLWVEGHSSPVTVGIDGVTTPRVSVVAVDNMNQVTPAIIGMDQGSHFMQAHLAANPAAKELFTVAFKRGGDGAFQIGSVDPSDYQGGLYCVSLIAKDKSKRHSPGSIGGNPEPTFTWWWQFPVDSMSLYGGTSTNLQAVVDTGTSVILANFNQWFDVSEVVGRRGLCKVLSSENQYLKVTIGTQTLSIGPKHYFPDGECLLYHAEGMNEGFVTLGQPFLAKYFTLHDYANERVGFGLQHGQPGQALPETCVV